MVPPEFEVAESPLGLPITLRQFQDQLSQLADQDEIQFLWSVALSGDDWKRVVDEAIVEPRWIASNPTLPLDLVKLLAHHPNAYTRMGIARRADLPFKLGEWLKDDEDEAVREAIAWRDDATPEILETLVHDPSPVVARVARDRLGELFSINWRDVAPRPPRALGSRPFTSAEEVVDAVERVPVVDYWRIADDPANEEVWRDVVARYPDAVPWVALNRTVSPSLLRDLGRSNDWIVRWAVATNPRADEETLTILALDADPTVRERAAWNLGTPAPWVLRLAADPNDDVRELARERLAERSIPPSTEAPKPEDVWLGRDGEIGTYPEFDRLLHSTRLDEVVRALFGPFSAYAAREALRQEQHAAWSVIRNPRVPVEVLREIARSDDDDLRRWLAIDLRPDEDIVASLARDPSDRVRYWVARSAVTPRRYLEMLTGDEEWDIAWAAWTNLHDRFGVEPPEEFRPVGADESETVS